MPGLVPGIDVSGRRGRRRGVEVDEHLAVADLRLVGLERDEAGRLDRLSTRDVKLAEVEAAIDLIAFEHAVGEVGEPVGAAAFRRIERAADIVDRDQLVADLAADHAVLRHVGGGTDWGFGHGSSAAGMTIHGALAAWRKSARGEGPSDVSPARSQAAIRPSIYRPANIAFGIIPWMPLVPSTTWVT